MASGALDPAIQEQMKAAYQILDPVELLRQMEVLQDAFWQHAQTAAKPKVNRSDQATVTAQLAMRKPFETGIQLKVQEARPDVGALTPSISTVGEQRGRRKYRRSEKPSVPHTWRTRKDPFKGVWDQVIQKLQLAPELTAKAIFIGLRT